MHARRTIVLLASLAVLAGCGAGKQESEPAGAGQKAMPAAPATPTQAAFAVPRLDQLPDVLVKIGDATLNKEDALRDATIRLGAMGDISQLDPGTRDRLQAQAVNHVADQFIARTLLMEEAERRGIEVTEADEKATYDRIRAALPEGRTIEGMITNSPIGAERMRAEVRASIVIGKLREQVVGEMDVTDAEIDQFTKDNKERLTVPENVHARHILIRTTQEDDDAAKAAKKEKAESIRKELVDGADFAEMAAKYSEGPSQDNGGDLGSFPRGKMVPTFENAAFTQKVGEIGPVLETQFGYHIIQVLEHKQAEMLPREQIIAIIKEQKIRREFGKFLNALKIKAGDTIEDFRTP